jgi:hypothetical protein
MSGQENKMCLRDLIQQGLAGFHIQEMTEIIRTDMDGRYSSSEGFLEKSVTADAYRQSLRDPSDTKTRSVLVLTNGHVGFAIADQEEIVLLDDVEVTLAARRAALAKLLPAERAILGFPEEEKPE